MGSADPTTANGARRAKQLWILALSGLLLLFPKYTIDSAVGACTMPAKPAGLVAASIVRVVDGDTLVVSVPADARRRLRLIGIDTPELHPSDKLKKDAVRSGRSVAVVQALGAKASDFAKRRLNDQTVELESDVQPHDRYGRALVYIWLGKELYNAAVVRDGYASPMTIPPNVKYADLFAACYREARDSRRGLWAIDN